MAQANATVLRQKLRDTVPSYPMLRVSDWHAPMDADESIEGDDIEVDDKPTTITITIRASDIAEGDRFAWLTPEYTNCLYGRWPEYASSFTRYIGTGSFMWHQAPCEHFGRSATRKTKPVHESGRRIIKGNHKTGFDG